MTFDEALDELEPRTIWSDEMRDLLEQLRQEYAPKIEMSKRHADNLIDMKNDGYSFVETIADIDSGVLIREFDSYWNPLTVDELMQAWLHPETIKIIDEEK